VTALKKLQFSTPNPDGTIDGGDIVWDGRSEVHDE
jgi:hypothetical protein